MHRLALLWLSPFGASGLQATSMVQGPRSAEPSPVLLSTMLCLQSEPSTSGRNGQTRNTGSDSVRRPVVDEAKLTEALEIKGLLEQNTEEVQSILRVSTACRRFVISQHSSLCGAACLGAIPCRTQKVAACVAHLTGHASSMLVRPELLLQALNGEYIQPEAGGDLLRDGAGVLPTGQLPDSMQRCTWLEGTPWCQQSHVSALPCTMPMPHS